MAGVMLWESLFVEDSRGGSRITNAHNDVGKNFIYFLHI